VRLRQTCAKARLTCGHLQERFPRSVVETPTRASDIEMDTLGDSGYNHARVRTKFHVSDKRTAVGRRDYFVGVALFLVVIVLWTVSGFVTQVRS
jgi:hypothetical protein